MDPSVAYKRLMASQERTEKKLDELIALLEAAFADKIPTPKPEPGAASAPKPARASK